MNSNGESFVCRAVCLVGTADLPGKCAVQGFTQYNGKCGCSFCEHEGEVVPVLKGHTQVYPYLVGTPPKLRTKQTTVTQGLLAQQNGSPVGRILCLSICSVKLTLKIKHSEENQLLLTGER